MHGQQNVRIFFQFVYVFVLCISLYSEARTEVFSWPRAASIHVFTASRSFVSNALVHSTRALLRNLNILRKSEMGFEILTLLLLKKRCCVVPAVLAVS